MKRKKKLESTVKIRFQDCDPFNHLNNAAYFNYLINAREDQIIDAYDLDVYRHGQQTGKSWVVSSHKIAYIKPAQLMEKVHITSQLIHFGEKHLLVEMSMWNITKSELKATLWSSFVYFDIRKATIAIHSPELMNIFKDVVLPLEIYDFDNRINELKGLTS